MPQRFDQLCRIFPPKSEGKQCRSAVSQGHSVRDVFATLEQKGLHHNGRKKRELRCQIYAARRRSNINTSIKHQYFNHYQIMSHVSPLDLIKHVHQTHPTEWMPMIYLSIVCIVKNTVHLTSCNHKLREPFCFAVKRKWQMFSIHWNLSFVNVWLTISYLQVFIQKSSWRITINDIC